MPSQSITALRMMVSNTGWTSFCELLMTRRISAVAVCCSRDSARRFSRSRTLASLFFVDLRPTGSLGSTLALAGFEPRRIGLSLPLKAPRAAYQSRTVPPSRTLAVPRLNQRARASRHQPGIDQRWTAFFAGTGDIS
jgi:hypothetical protein